MSEETLGDLAERQKKVQAELEQIRQGKLLQQRRPYRMRPWEVSEPAPAQEEESWLTTYLDMMTLLLVLMIVMLAFAGKRAAESGAAQGGGAAHIAVQGGSGVFPAGAGLFPLDGNGKPGNNGLDDGLAFGDLGDDIDVLVNDQSISFRINSEILFGSGQADLSREGLQLMSKLATVMTQLGYQVAVEGHTDSVPIRSHRFPSNWELSGARAGSVVRYLQANGVGADKLRAVGYADTRPLASNDSAEGRASNRRVELVMERPVAQDASSAPVAIDEVP